MRSHGTSKVRGIDQRFMVVASVPNVIIFLYLNFIMRSTIMWECSQDFALLCDHVCLSWDFMMITFVGMLVIIL